MFPHGYAVVVVWQDVSDRIEKEKEDSEVVQRLEKEAHAIVRWDWRRNITQELQNGEDLL